MDEQRTEELKHDIRASRRRMGTTIDEIEDRVRPGRVIERRVERMRQGGRRFSQRVMGMPGDAAHGAADAASTAVEEVGQKAHDTVDRTRDAAAGSPLVAGAIAFGLGALVAAAFPTTPEERDLAHRAEEPLSDEVRSMASEVKDLASEHASQLSSEAGSTLSDAAERAGDDARAAARQVTSSAPSTR
jgi:hypothetical protein